MLEINGFLCWKEGLHLFVNAIPLWIEKKTHNFFFFLSITYPTPMFILFICFGTETTDSIKDFSKPKSLVLYQFPRAAVTSVPQTGRLKTMWICCLTVVEARNLKSKCRQGYAPGETYRRESFLVSPWDLVGGLQSLPVFGLQLHTSSLCFLLHLVFSLCLCAFTLLSF